MSRGTHTVPGSVTEAGVGVFHISGQDATRVSLATWHALAELLGKRDNDALGPADVG